MVNLGIIIVAGLLALSLGAGLWSHKEKRRLRKIILGDRQLFSESEMIALFNPQQQYENVWLLQVLKEVADSVAADKCMLRPTDRLGYELQNIKGFDFATNPFDWLPNDVDQQVSYETDLRALIQLLYKSDFLF